MIRIDVRFKFRGSTQYRTFQTEDNGDNLYIGSIKVHKISEEKGFNSVGKFKHYVRSYLKEVEKLWNVKTIEWRPFADSLDRMKNVPERMIELKRLEDQ